MTMTAILGVTGTIGSTLARRLVKGGRRVLLVGRDGDKLARLSAELDQPFAVMDATNSQSVSDALQGVAVDNDGLDGIVNCIGSLILKPAHATSDEEFRRVVETNLFTAFATVRAGAKMLREHGGVIVLFASAAAEIGIQNHEAIAAAKEQHRNVKWPRDALNAIRSTASPGDATRF